jgi:ion channel-forming bestrophin family protein
MRRKLILVLDRIYAVDSPPQPNWFRTAFQIKGSIFPAVLPRVLLFSGFGVGVSLLHRTSLPLNFSILGDLTNNVACNLVLGLLLVFRTNTAYDRFWEGRKAWGTLVVNLRNLSREIQIGIAAATDQDQTEKKQALLLLVVFAIATKLHLRQQAIEDELDRFMAPEAIAKLSVARNPPLEVIRLLSDYLQCRYRDHQMEDGNQRWVMNQLLNEITNGLTNCERILTTPIPVAYSIYLKSLLLLYCSFLPFSLVDQLDLWTGFVVAIVSFILLGVEEIANEIEDPFGTDPNDLPLDKICDTILSNVEEAIAFQPSSVPDR